MSLDSIVNITIENTSPRVSQQGFGTPMVLGYHTKWLDRYREYSGLTGMVDDGFATTDPEYKAVASIFAQNPSPETVIVGRRDTAFAQSVRLVPSNTTEDYVYTVTINGTAFTYTVLSGDTVANVCTGLAAAINAGLLAVTADGISGTHVDVDADVSGTLFEIVPGNDDDLSIQDLTADAGVATALTAVATESTDWYAFVLTTNCQAEIEAAASWAESNDKFFAACCSDTEIKDSGVSDDTFSNLKTSAYDRTLALFHQDPYGDYPNAAWLGKILPKDPGGVNWGFKTLAGVAATDLTTSEQSTIVSKGGNYYVSKGGVNATFSGRMPSDEWADIVRGLDWTEARIQEAIYGLLTSTDKIPFTNPGVELVLAEIRAVLTQGARNGLYVADSIVVSAPDVADVSAANKANRLLPDVEFSATLAGAINKVTINGKVSV